PRSYFVLPGAVKCMLLINIASRMALMPAPGGLDDRRKLCVARPPAEFSLNFFRRSHEGRWVARPAWALFERHFLAGYLFSGTNHLAHAVTPAGPQVVA